MNQKEQDYTQLFEKRVRQRGWEFRESTRQEDMHQHIDCHVTITDRGKAVRSFSVDLKGIKYNSRSNEGIRECMCQYIEFLNVRGNNGWLFGNADYIAILDENGEKFYVVSRIDLINFCERLFDIRLNGSIEQIESRLLALTDKWVKRADQAHHKLYRRHSRKDIITQINMADVHAITKFTL